MYSSLPSQVSFSVKRLAVISRKKFIDYNVAMTFILIIIIIIIIIGRP